MVGPNITAAQDREASFEYAGFDDPARETKMVGQYAQRFEHQCALGSRGQRAWIAWSPFRQRHQTLQHFRR
jgi:hypothetical protein